MKVALKFLILFPFFLFVLLGQMKCQVDRPTYFVEGGFQARNTYGNRINDLIGEFNSARFPFIIDKNLPSINFPLGFFIGGGKIINDQFSIQGTIDWKSQAVSTFFIEEETHLQYLLRGISIGIGGEYIFSQSDKIFQSAKTGILLNIVSIYNNFSDKKGGIKPNRDSNLGNGVSPGISLSYVFQYRLFPFLGFFIEPGLQLSLPSYIRNLDSFFNPVWEADVIKYHATQEESKNKISYNGLGIQTGIKVFLPSFKN